MEPGRSGRPEQEPGQQQGAEMKKITTRFGEVEYDPEKIIHFPEGLIGFELLRDFIVMPNVKDGPLFWIQSIDDPQIAFVLTDPTNFFLDYRVQPGKKEKAALGIENGDEYFALSVVTVQVGGTVTLNLAAPILFLPKNNRAMQIILEDSRYTTKHALPSAK